MTFKGIKPHTSGFTIFEVLIVIGMIGILAGIAFPTIGKFLPEFRFRSSVRDIVSCLQEAKLEAIKRNTDVVVVFTTTGYRSFVDNGAGDSTKAKNREEDPGEISIRIVNLDSDTTLSLNGSPGVDPNPMGFNSRGFGATANSTLRIENTNANFRTIAFSTSGNVRVQH